MEKAIKVKVRIQERKGKRMSKEAYKRPNKSNKMVEKLKLERFNEIFHMLDLDNDGEISASNIDITCIYSLLYIYIYIYI